MNCHDAREEFSGWLDETLPTDARARVAAHFEGCGDCRRELDRFQGTVALLRRVERPRAPAGFADRVLRTVRPTPWATRLSRWLFVPLHAKIPAEVAALLLVAGLAVYVVNHTPALRQAARDEVSRSVSSSAPSGPAAPPEKLEAPRSKPERAPKVATEIEEKKADVSQDAGRAVPDERATAAPPQTSGSPAPPSTLEGRKETSGGNVMSSAAREAGQPAPPAPSAPSLRDSAKQAPAAAAPQALMRYRSAGGVWGRLIVTDREAAVRSLVDLLARLGGTLVARREDAASTLVELVVPRAGYDAFVRELPRIGLWTLEADRSEAAPEVHVTLRLAE
jgi:hypothetical protein